jgi:hypothetical protein
MISKRGLIISGAVSAFLLVLCLMPFAFDEWIWRQDLAAFLHDGVGEALSPTDTILDFKCSRSPRGDTTFCRFKPSSEINTKLYTYGTLPPSAKDIIEVVSHRLNITPSLLPELTINAFDFAPNHKEPQSWLIMYDRKQEIGWAFVAD